MNICPRLFGLCAITTIVIFTFFYTLRPLLVSKEKDMELIKTLKEALLGKKKEDPPPRSQEKDSVEAMMRNLRQRGSYYLVSTKIFKTIFAETHRVDYCLNLQPKPLQRKRLEMHFTQSWPSLCRGSAGELVTYVNSR